MNKREIVRKLTSMNLDDKDKEELTDMLLNSKFAVDIDKEEEKTCSFGDRMADKISATLGGWKFIFLVCLFLFVWIILNLFFIDADPYPFILLNLILSCVAAIQAPIIMMSQNRAAKKDSARNKNDYITDLKSELILEDLHRKLELILKNQSKLLDLYEKKDS